MPVVKIEVTVPEENNLERIDKFLPSSMEIDLSRSYIQKLIRNGNISANGHNIKQNYRIKTDDLITVEIPEPEELKLNPENIPLEIVYEDRSIAVILKPPGLVVHPAPGNWNMTLVNSLLYHIKDLSTIGGIIRPGIVHRLDKDTSGLMVIAKNDASHRFLSDEFYNRRVKKIYCAIVSGNPERDHGIIDLPIGRHRKYRHKMTVVENGRNAVTEFTLKKMWNFQNRIFSLLEINLHTGRTHQIRVHLSSMGNPIVGDPIYSKKWQKHRVPYLLLASTSLEFIHPKDRVLMSFKTDMPERMIIFINRLGKSMLP